MKRPLSLIILPLAFSIFAFGKPQTTPTPEQTDASAAVDQFLKGVKLAGLREGKAMMAEVQWITGDADYGENFYTRPVYTDAKILFEGMFETDVPGVLGYKRLMEMQAVSKAKTPLQVQFIAIAYKEKTSGKWKVLDTGTDDSVDVDAGVAYFSSILSETDVFSEQFNYANYGHSLLRAGRIKDARTALQHAATSRQDPDEPPKNSEEFKETIRRKIDALLSVVSRLE